MTESIGDEFANDISELQFPQMDEGISDTIHDSLTGAYDDVKTTGEGLYDTTGATLSSLEDDTVSHAEALGSDIAGGHPIAAIEDLAGGLWDDGADVVEGVGADVGELGMGIVTAGGSLLGGAESVAGSAVDDIGDGIEDVVDDIGDLF